MERNNYRKVAITCTNSFERSDDLNTLHKKRNEQK